MKIFQEIKERRLREWAAVYISSGLTIIGVVHLFSLRYSLPSYIFDTVLVILFFGFFSVITAAWRHGQKGRQKTNLKEIAAHLVIFLLAVIIFYRFILIPNNNNKIEIEANSIAVLPFDNLSDSKEEEYFSDGVTEDILSHLSKVSGLKVISRTSVMKYKDLDKNIREIANELGVETILEGSVRRSGNRVRIVSQLIDAATDDHIWSETYDRELDDIFSIQTEIAEKITAALQTNLLPLEKELIEEQNPVNIDAYTFYLKGRHYYYNYNEEDNERAIDLFKKALNVDSAYALALAGLADAYNQKVIKYWHSDEWLDSALILSKKAIKINPNLPESYKALALTYDNLGERNLALSAYEKALRLNPNFASAALNYGQLKLAAGKYDEALYWFRRTNSLEPDNIWAIMSIANVYKILRCDDLAIQWGEKAIFLDDQNAFIQMLAADIYLYSGDFKSANEHINNAVLIDDKLFLNWFFKSQIETVLGNYKLAKEYMDSSMTLNGTGDPEYFYGHTLLHLEDKNKALKILEDEKKEYKDFLQEYPDDVSIMDHIALAEIYAILNEKENAFEMWETAIDRGWLDIKRNTLYPYFENLRDDPRYGILINKIQHKIDESKSSIKKKYPETEICE